MDIIYVGDDTCVPFDTCPERHMLLEVLYRAVRDLAPNMPKQVTRDAVQWFNGQTPGDSGFTFKQILEELGLSDGQADYLVKQASEATKRLYEP